MIKFAVLSLAALAIALPAAADQRGHGHNTKQSVIDTDAKVKGIAKVDADVLTPSRKSTLILDLNATVGKLGVTTDLDISKKKGLSLDLNLGKAGKGGRGGHGGHGGYGGYGGGYEDCGCEGGVGN